MNRAAFVAASLALFACNGFDRSALYRCEATADCDGTRVCDRGYCVQTVDQDGPMADAPDPPPGCEVWPDQRHFKPCELLAPVALDLSMPGTYLYDTSTGTLTNPAGTPRELLGIDKPTGYALSVEAFTIPSGSTFRVIGNKALIVASWSTIAIAGELDASSRMGDPGAGNDATCTGRAPIAGAQADGGGGGGGGGGLGGAGGRGGIGDVLNGGAAGGTRIDPLPLLAGGCAGAKGGDGDPGFVGGTGGLGGGAVQLTAKDSIEITGTLHAGGEGGGGATANGQNNDNGKGDGGGGGGGSGGMLGLDAPSLRITGGTLAANGGGGGGGADNLPGLRGADGAPSMMRAAGGNGGAQNGRNGGLGSGGMMLDGGLESGNGDNGAGAGGGGAGLIVIASPDATTTGTFSPPITSLQ